MSDVLTVDAFLVGKCLTLLCFIPIKDQPVAECQGSSSIGSGFITVVERACERGLDMADGFLLEFFGSGERLGRLLHVNESGL